MRITIAVPHAPPPTSSLDRLMPLVISAPFGNYIKPRGATPTLGTFTVDKRPGRLIQIIKTVRYHRKLHAWTNRLGLRNPGLGWLEAQVKRGKIDVKKAIISLHGFTGGEWAELLDRGCQLKPMAIELNLSCPNVGEVSWPDNVFQLALEAGGVSEVGVIAKLPPVRFEGMAKAALAAGVHSFHCCNTVPVPAGGMSGKPLIPLSLACISKVRKFAEATGCGAELVLIGGGGITTSEDIDRYMQAGAKHVAIGTKAMDPRLIWTDGPLRGLIEHARGAK